MGLRVTGENYEFPTCATCDNVDKCQFDIRIPGAMIIANIAYRAERATTDKDYVDYAFSYGAGADGMIARRISEGANEFFESRPWCTLTEDLVRNLMEEATEFYKEYGIPKIEIEGI